MRGENIMGKQYILRKGSATLEDLADGGMASFPYGSGGQFYLDPTNGSDGNDGKSPLSAFKTLAVAYAALTDGKNQVLFYIPGSSSITLSAAFIWAKSYTHLVGLCAPTHVYQRARFFQLSTLTNASPLFTVSGSSCIFANLYINQGVADAGSLVDVLVSGDRNYFENVHFAGSSAAEQNIDGGSSLQISGDENLFQDCTIGTDTIVSATGVSALTFATGSEAARNRFNHCEFRIWANSTGCAFVEANNLTAISRDTIMDNCIFINTSAAGGTSALASAFVVPGSTTGRFHLKDCMFSNVTKLDASDTGCVKGNMNAVTAADLSGVSVNMYV
jgi:hypothetical protein